MRRSGRWPIRRQFLEDLGAKSLEERLGSLRRALLVLHAPTDSIVGIENASRIFQAARHPKSFVSLDGADHLLGRRADSRYAAAVIAAWASRYLPPPRSTVRDEGDEGEVVVMETRESEYGQSIVAGRHLLRADEPRPVGGEDSGPTPYGLLLASLGACTTMTLRMYANRKKLPLERVTLRLRHERIHARDCAECEGIDGSIDRIDKEIRLEGDLDEAQRQRLLEIADRCPVHRTLRSEVSIASRLAPRQTGPLRTAPPGPES